ncbi:MMPL family transporter [Streptomyces sp. NPDC007095]|uniref:MMPL family transporter n=1 Tax=Streptomyces sp. NPDC007095 TaxID=3154482 RepID=UPI0033D3F178
MRQHLRRQARRPLLGARHRVAACSGQSEQDPPGSLGRERPDRLHRPQGPPGHRGPVRRGHRSDRGGKAKKAPQVGEVVDPGTSGAVSADRTTAIVQVQYPVQNAQVHTSSVDVIENAAKATEQDGLKTSVGGSVYSALAGRGAWWLPAWLDRILPDLDVEGTSLQKAAPAHHKEPQPVS